MNFFWGSFFLCLQAVYGQQENHPLIIDLKTKIQQKQQLSGDFDIILDNQSLLTMIKEGTIDTLSIQENGQGFSAQAVSTVNNKEHRTPLSGRIQMLIPIPVLSRPMAVGDVLSGADFVWQKVPLSKVNQGCYTKIEEMVGKTPNLRVLSPNQPIMKMDLKSPVLVRRNSNIRVYYRTNNIEISRIAEAQQDGGKGDIVRFTTETKKVLHARVLSPTEAEVVL